jgi:hypothetical protein
MAQNVPISFGYLIFKKNHNELPKVAQLAKTVPSGHPVARQDGHSNQQLSHHLDKTYERSSLLSLDVSDAEKSF